MRRREKPKPVLGPGERPPCGFQWKVDPETGELYSGGCRCGLPYGDHPRYRELMRQAIASEAGPGEMKRQIERALRERIAVNERTWPLSRTTLLRENGQRGRYRLDGVATDADDEPTV